MVSRHVLSQLARSTDSWLKPLSRRASVSAISNYSVRRDDERSDGKQMKHLENESKFSKDVSVTEKDILRFSASSAGVHSAFIFRKGFSSRICSRQDIVLRNGLGGPFTNARFASTTSEGSSAAAAEAPVNLDYVNAGEILSDAASIEVVNKASAVSEVAVAAADCSFPVACLHYFIEAFHVHFGLPWWASIAATTAVIRFLTIPVLISQLKSTSRLTMLRPKLEEFTKQMKESTDLKVQEEARRRVQDLFKEYKVTPFTPFKGVLIQGPIFLSFYFAITNMAEHVPSFKSGGALWFVDLSTPDNMFILPVLTALSFLATVELNMQEGLEGNPMAGKMKNVSRVFGLLTVPVTMHFPKAIFCYWITSNLFSLVYGAVMKRPDVKKALGIPVIPLTPDGSTLFSGVSSTADSKPPTTSVAVEKASPSSALLRQRLKALERNIKAKKHGRKR
eukprot:TRINITY_DN6626_c0_g1_i1.p1 TRINITY_DN6626_c0_g1~~TRINITY_DN6626_c0_g1_i1.p1  ORF type:complete len:450 (+),score=62.69 TRINITY_DN6626_c0_g1_i1:223-1572(+)